MSLPGAPQSPRSRLDRIRSATDHVAMGAMRRQAWQQHGVIALSITDITDPWLHQAITNEATRSWVPRSRGHDTGR